MGARGIERMIMNRIGAVVLLGMLAMAGTVDAQQIASARHDAIANQLIIRGGPFSPGARVFLDVAELTVVSLGPTEIRATLIAPESGSHRLIVFQPPSQVVTFSVTTGLSEHTALIMRDDFEMNPLSPSDWDINVVGGATFRLPPDTLGTLVLNTDQPSSNSGSVTLRGLRSFALNTGTLIFTTRVVDAFVDTTVHGDAQPRGLAAGFDRSNAIEFVSAFPVPSTVACRTVAGGQVTQTTVDIGQSVREPAVYQIIARPSEVRFFVNGELKCTHRTNIPTTVALNPYFATDDGGGGNIRLAIDWVSFERRVP
jgi:hypothetical protein